ncbi:hypothetical protein EJ07DRAFT_157386 [Lizonia empirigonia]|nr:hypothetical protein EJ07DRAFT_157386 [Lizonia empirigonia]
MSESAEVQLPHQLRLQQIRAHLTSGAVKIDVIGLRDYLPVYVFPALNAILTIQHGKIPSLAQLRDSLESLRTVDLLAPFHQVDEWKAAKSDDLGRELHAFAQYLLLCDAAARNWCGSIDFIDVEDLKAALVKISRGRKPDLTVSGSRRMSASPQTNEAVDAGVALLENDTTPTAISPNGMQTRNSGHATVATDDDSLGFNDDTDVESAIDQVAEQHDRPDAVSAANEDAAPQAIERNSKRRLDNTAHIEGGETQPEAVPRSHDLAHPNPPPATESLSALIQFLGREALSLLLRNTRLEFRKRRARNALGSSLGVCVGTLARSPNVAVYFYLSPGTDPSRRPTLSYETFDMSNKSPVYWKSPRTWEETLRTVINAHPAFAAWPAPADFLALLCLTTIVASEVHLRGPYNHHIPVAEYCRGRLALMCRRAAEASANVTERVQVSNFSRGSTHQSSHNYESEARLEAAQALIKLSSREIRFSQRSFGSHHLPAPSGQDTTAMVRPSYELESLPALTLAIGETSLTVLLEHPIEVIYRHSADTIFLPLGVHVGSWTGSEQATRTVFAFLAPERGTEFMAPLILAVYDDARQSYLKLADSSSPQVALAQVLPSPAFTVAESTEDVLALVSLAVLRAADKKMFGFVDHRIPVIAWCRGHLVTMVKRAWMKKNEADRSSRLKRVHENMDRGFSEAHRPQQRSAKRLRTVEVTGPQIPDSNSVDEAFAAETSSAHLINLLHRNFQIAGAHSQHGEQMLVWLTQNIAARKSLESLARKGKADTQQYSDLQAIAKARDAHMLRCLGTQIFATNELGHEINKRLFEFVNGSESTVSK